MTSMCTFILALEKITDNSDKEPPTIVKSTGILTFGFDVTGQTIENQGIKITPDKDDAGHVTSIKIEGAAGTAATKRDDDPAGTPFATIRVYKLQKPGYSDRFEYLEVKTLTADRDGSFPKLEDGQELEDLRIPAQQGNRLTVTVEKGGIALNQEFVLSFSEPLDTEYETNNVPIPISIYEYEEEGQTGKEIPVKTELPEVNGQVSGTEVIVKLENQLDENQVYVLKTMDNQENGLSDRSGNELKIACNFRAKRSYRLFVETGTHDVLDTELIGGTLFVASGFEGIRIFDVSNPSGIHLITTYTNFAGKVQGLARYVEIEEVIDPITQEKEIIKHNRLVVVGGGSTCLGFIKILDISDLENKYIFQLKSQVISDNMTDSTNLPEGHPRYVQVLGQYAFVTIRNAGLAVVDIEGMTVQSNRYNLNAVIRYHHEGFIFDAAPYQRLVKDRENPEDPGKQQVLAVVLVNGFGIKILDMNRQANENPTAPYSKYYMLEVGSYQLPSTLQSTLGGLVLAQDYWVDVDRDGLRGEAENNDEDEMSGEDEERDMVFFAIPREFKIVVLDITCTKTSPNIDPAFHGILEMKKDQYEDALQYEYALNIRDMEISAEDQVLYVTDLQEGLVLLDMSISGTNIYSKSSEERYLGNIHTSGHSQFGLIIDEELKTAYVGQADKGVDVIKLGNPEIKFVYKTPEGTFREVTKICPYGIKQGDNPDNYPNDNPDNYPDVIYVMGIFPGGIARNVSTGIDDKTIYCELWTLNSAQAPMIPWENGEIKTYKKKLELYRQSNTPVDDKYNVFLSDPIRVTIAPDKEMMDDPPVIDPTLIEILSGDIMWAHLSEDFIVEYKKENYINPFEAPQIGDKKPSIRADLIDREENFAFEGVPDNEPEKPNSPVNNPAMVSNVMLDTGEFVYNEVDLYIPGRGFDFVFARTYRSQAIYSGPLGWGWDHNYNRRLVELYSGDIIYYDGSGRRERFKVNGQPGTYQAPSGWFAELIRSEDGTFRLIYSEGIIESFDSLGRLIKIQDRNKNKMEFYYNISGQMSTVIDAMGRLINFEYNNYSIEEIRNSGEVKPDHGRLSRMIDFSGRVVEFTYNNTNGDLWKVEITSENDEDKADPKFHSRTVTYNYHPNPGSDINLSHNLFTITDPKGQTSLTVNYDGNGKDKVINHISGDSTVKYDLEPGNPSVFDGRNNEKRFILNNEGHIESITEVTEDGLNPTTGFGYVDGLLNTVKFPRSNSISVRYDYKKGILDTITEFPAEGAVEDPEYPVESSRITTFTYEGNKNNLQSIEYSGGLKQHYTYNEFGQVTSEYANTVLGGNIIPMGQTLLYEYHPESNPGGEAPTQESPRMLDSSSGGYLRRSTSSFGEILNPNDWGYWENYTYNHRGNLSGMNSYNEISSSYRTNIFNQVTFETIKSNFTESLSPLSYTGDYGYDKNGNLETETTTSGSLTRSATYNHDERNNLRSVNDSIQGITSYTYDENDNVTSISGPGGTMNFTYNMRDLVHTTTIGDETYIFTYDGNGNMSTFTDPYGYTTTYGYDGYDRLSLVKDPLNNITLIGRAQFGNLLSLKHLDNTGQELLFHSISIDDPLGRMTSYTVKMPEGEDINYTLTYEADGKIIKIKDPLERESIVEKNDDGRVKKVTDAAGNVTEYFYEDGRGNATRVLETVRSSDGQKTETYETSYEYNAHNKLEKIIDPQEFVTEFYYDKMGNLTGTKDAEENKITHEYDNLGRRTKTIKHFKNGQKIETFFEYYPPNTYNPNDNTGEYNPSNRLKSITDDKGNKTTYEYDHQNRIKKIVYPDESFIEYTYDKVEAGTNPEGDMVYYRLLIEEQRDGTIVKHYFDQVQRLMKREIIPAEGAVGTTLETFEYDGLSRVNKAVDNDSELNFFYDRASRLDWEKRANKLIDYTYDKLSNLRKIQYPNTRLFERDFDQLNRMNLIKEGSISIAEMTHIGRSYRLLRKQYGNGDLIQYLYDQGRRLEYKETKNKNSELINHYKYGYNKVHMKTFEQRLHDSGKGNVMAYDELYRLTGMKFNVPDPTIENPTTFEKEKAIKYDHLHNILSMVENYNGQTKTITTDIPENSDYSKLNQYASFDQWGLDYDKKGNTTQRGTQQLAYNYRNQLVTAADATSNTQVEMRYDVLGRRIQKSVNIGSQTKIENYYHSGHQVIEVRDENDQLLRQYIYGNGIDEIIRMDKYEGDTVTSYYYHTDANGSVTAITDENGQLIERVTYDIYGMPTFWDAVGNKISKSSIGNNILFHGREYDYELNLYYFRARYYDPIMGRFLQTDPMGYQDSLNLYQGFNMNPYNFGDPWGLSLKLSRSEMQQFESNLTDILIELYSSKYDAETAAQLIDFILYHATLENKVWAFNELTDLNLEAPEKLGVLGKVFGAAKSYANFSKKVGAKVKQWLGADEAQERIDSAEDHMLVQEGVTLPGLLTIGDQLNLAFAKGAADIVEFATEELQWAIVAGVSGKVLQKAGKLRRGKKIKAINLPSWKKVKIDIDHIASGHMKGGSRVSSLKDLFPEHMTKKQIERQVRQAYRYGKKLKRQGNRVLVVGEYGGITIEMWVNLETKVIETAYPIF